MSSYRGLERIDKPLLAKVAVSSTNTYETEPINISSLQTLTFQAEWTGTISGTMSILGSLDGVNFRDFGASVSPQPAGSDGGVLVPLYGSGMKWVKLSYTNATGSGTLTVTALGKTR